MKSGTYKKGISMTRTILSVGRLITLVTIGLVLASCSYLEGVTQSVKTTNDKLAGTLITGMCGITVGAYYRLKNPVYKEGIRKLCGGNNTIELSE